MTWTSGLPLGLLKRVRTITLSPQAGLTHFIVKEEVSGPWRHFSETPGQTPPEP